MERGWDLAPAVKQLPVKQQHVIALHYYQGMTLDSPCGRISGTLPAPAYFFKNMLGGVGVPSEFASTCTGMPTLLPGLGLYDATTFCGGPIG